MKIAYVDTSSLLAIAFGEPGSRRHASRLRGFERLFASNLLEAEFRSALVRERISADASAFLSHVTWVHPDRPLTPEIEKVLGLGHLRGADVWHLACALFLSPRPHELSFLTADEAQLETARKLGFTV